MTENTFDTGSTVPTAANAAPDAPRRNRPRWDDLPVADDTANLREGPDLHPLCTGLLPLVGVSGATAVYALWLVRRLFTTPPAPAPATHEQPEVTP